MGRLQGLGTNTHTRAWDEWPSYRSVGLRSRSLESVATAPTPRTTTRRETRLATAVAVAATTLHVAHFVLSQGLDVILPVAPSLIILLTVSLYFLTVLSLPLFLLLLQLR